jgi:hypothetical protein
MLRLSSGSSCLSANMMFIEWLPLPQSDIFAPLPIRIRDLEANDSRVSKAGIVIGLAFSVNVRLPIFIP